MSFLRHQQARKFFFYAKGISEYLFLPNFLYRRKLAKKLKSLENFDKAERELIERRLAYYCKLEAAFEPSPHACKLADVPHRKTTYFIDFRRLFRHFSPNVLSTFRFGDVTDVTDYPRFVKTRPIHQPHETSVLLRLNSIRHFRPILDKTPYREKKDSLIWRGKIYRDHRLTIFKKHFGNPMCDLGKTNSLVEGDDPAWAKPFTPIQEQLEHKFILSVEGNDVATNLKWIAQSNSLCFMTRPKFESWFMEGTLKDGEHYVELKDDYSDLQEKLDYYLAHPSEAEAIIANFQKYYQSFCNPAKEELLGLLVSQKFLKLSGQLDS